MGNSRRQVKGIGTGPWCGFATSEEMEQFGRKFGRDIAEELNVKEVWMLTSRGLVCVHWRKGKPEPTRADFHKWADSQLDEHLSNSVKE